MIDTYPDMRGFDWDLEEPDRRLGELCEGNEIPFWSLLAGFRQTAQTSVRPLFWEFDHHWTPEGHDRGPPGRSQPFLGLGVLGVLGVLIGPSPALDSKHSPAW